ncbi:kinase-like protein [Dacryopinax primogenitus]|uniref:non-specific serine/threonine protein kinase n=1 Tax=Dacryopinax primogenitus (strain DJM 731) TaxID=1858805 RepID=M5FQV7_DACPD|nr:kinase-like protein [Dacryopinax primogenitus]EJT97973.1 kinase-like protein [Dacryopinax primogenitus]
MAVRRFWATYLPGLPHLGVGTRSVSYPRFRRYGGVWNNQRTWSSAARTAVQSESQQKRESWHTAEESIERYVEGGYHPVSIGDTFKDGRYTVVRKLGWGRYSTIWLAKDNKKDIYVSLKLLTSEWTPREDLLSEAAFLRKASTANPSHPGSQHVLTLLDEFRFKGPNGTHIVLVTDVLGEDLVTVRGRYDGGRLPVGVVKQVSKQVLLGLQYLHKECGITHTDMKPDNILIALSPPPAICDPSLSPSVVSNNFISECLSVLKPQAEMITSPSGDPVPISVSQALPIFAMRKATNGNHPLEIRVKIVDLGVANWNDRHWADMIESPAMRAPEVILRAGWDTKADIWSAGCMIYELIMGEWLFTPRGSQLYTQEQDHLSQISALLGPIPSSLVDQGKYSHKQFDAHGSLPIISHPPRTPSLEKRVERQDALSADQFAGFVSFLRAMLQIDPGRRASATELLEHDWIREGKEVHWWSAV